MPVDRGAIDQQLREIGESERWWEQREFRDLPYILHPDERIRALVVGKLLASRRPRVLPAARWLVVVTEQRLICLRQQRVGRKEVDIPIGMITGLRHRTRVRTYQIVLETALRRYRLRVPKADAFRLVGALAPLVQRPGPTPAAAGVPGPAWIPGWSAIAAIPGVSEFVSWAMEPPAPPQPPHATRAHVARVEAGVTRLEADVEEMQRTLLHLQEQVEFLEALLRDRTAALPPTAALADADAET